MSRVQLPPGTERVLVVEDQDALRQSLSVVLDRMGYDVYQASTENEAKFVAGAVEIDLLITDVVIPSTCGVTVAGIVTDYRPDVPVLYMSGSSWKGGRGFCRGVSARGWPWAGLCSQAPGCYSWTSRSPPSTGPYAWRSLRPCATTPKSTALRWSW